MAVKRSELLDVSTQYWYKKELGETVIDDLGEMMAGVLLNLTGAGMGVIPSGPEQGLALINNVSGTQYDALETFITNSFNGVDLETSGAHLVYMFFDKQMPVKMFNNLAVVFIICNVLSRSRPNSIILRTWGHESSR